MSDKAVYKLCNSISSSALRPSITHFVLWSPGRLTSRKLNSAAARVTSDLKAIWTFISR